MTADDLWTHMLHKDVLARPYTYGPSLPSAEVGKAGEVTVLPPKTLCSYLGTQEAPMVPGEEPRVVMFWAAPDGARQLFKCPEADWIACAEQMPHDAGGSLLSGVPYDPL